MAAPSTRAYQQREQSSDVSQVIDVSLRASAHLRQYDLHFGHFKNAQQSMGRQFIILVVDVMTYRLENRRAVLLCGDRK